MGTSELSTVDCIVERSDTPEFRKCIVSDCLLSSSVLTLKQNKSELITNGCDVERSDAPELRALCILQCFRVTLIENK